MLQSIPHQIVQSPARLALPNPNSPSVQNPTPLKFSSQTQQSHHPHQSPNQLTVSAVSPALLPLLPPLPRAQSLLLQMAALAAKLFEVSPNCSHWLSAFRGSLPSFLSSQTQPLMPAPSDSAPSSTKDILAQLTTLQTQLIEAVVELQEILDLQDANEKLTREIRSKDSALLAFANKLKEADHVLDILVDDYSNYHRPKRTKSDGTSTTTVETHLKVSDILSYAHKISYTTFAPPEFGAVQAPLRGALPPAPQEEQMRASQLYNFADLDVGLHKMDDGKDKVLEPFIGTLRGYPQKATLCQVFQVSFLQILLFRLDGNPGCPWNCQLIYQFSLRLVGSLVTQLRCHFWTLFLAHRGLRNSNRGLFLYLGSQKHQRLNKSGMCSLTLKMIVVIIAATLAALIVMINQSSPGT